jgi:hypothetical protein
VARIEMSAMAAETKRDPGLEWLDHVQPVGLVVAPVPLPEQLQVHLPQHETTLTPTWAVKELGGDGQGSQLLVRVEATGIDPDARGALEGWEATPHQRLERLLRESGVFAGLLITERNERKDGKDRYVPELRLIFQSPDRKLAPE